MTRRARSSCGMICAIAIMIGAHAEAETLSFQRTPDGGFEALLDGFSDGPGCNPEFQPAADIDIAGSTITILSPEDATGCFLPYTAPPYRRVVELGALSEARYDVVWMQPGLESVSRVLVPAAVGNLVANSDFDDGTTSWSAVNADGTIAIDAASGVPDAPSLHLVDESAQSDCITVDDTVPVDVRALVKSDRGFADVSIQPYSDAACTAPLDRLAAGSHAANGIWQAIALTDATLPSGTHAVRIVLGASGDVAGSGGDAHFDHVAFGQTGSVPDGIYVQQAGLTGTWYDPSTSGQGFEFVIGDGGAAAQPALFGAWYTYTRAGSPSEQRWYSLQASAPVPGGPTGFTIFENTGGDFDAPPVTTAEPVGSGTLAFYSCTSGLLTYSFENGDTGAIPIRRAMPDIGCDPRGVPLAPVASDFGFSGAWYEPETSGQGLIVEINPALGQAFFGWYTYAVNGSTNAAHSQRWFSAQAPYEIGTRTIDLVLYATTGGAFDTPGGVTTVPVGTATLEFLDCTTATLAYSFASGELNGRSGTIALSRPFPQSPCPTDIEGANASR